MKTEPRSSASLVQGKKWALTTRIVLLLVFLGPLAPIPEVVSAFGSPVQLSDIQGSWSGQYGGETVLLVFESAEQLYFDGDSVSYRLGPDYIEVMLAEGPVRYPVRKGGEMLVITFPDGQNVVFNRADDGDVSRAKQEAKRIDDLLVELLTHYNWSSFSFRSSSNGYSATNYGMLYFYQDGTWSRTKRSEGHSMGTEGNYASQTDSGDGGRWAIRSGMLYASEGNGPMGEVHFAIECNKKGRHNGDEPFLLVNGNFRYDEEGGIRCGCGGAPLLYIEGKEYMISRK